MRNRILTAFGVLAAITGLASSVQAQPSVASNSRTGEFTLSGTSLVGIRNRTVDTDFNRFFLRNSSTPTSNRAGTVPNSIDSNDVVINSNIDPQDLGAIQVNDDVQLVSNESLFSPIIRVPGQQNQPFHNTERVQFQINP
ncbi:MAG TPA: hypothetical protein V6D11_22880 [Waterburya sp.]|jgi:hypothetical protein